MYDNNPANFLNLRRLPARVDCHAAGVLLNFDEVAVRALMGMGYLKPLGNPKGNEHKYFSNATIQKLAQDEKWLGEATRALNKYWAGKNGRRTVINNR
jgi:hypothetical protein